MRQRPKLQQVNTPKNENNPFLQNALLGFFLQEDRTGIPGRLGIQRSLKTVFNHCLNIVGAAARQNSSSRILFT
jgi:hypothetical protein